MAGGCDTVASCPEWGLSAVELLADSHLTSPKRIHSSDHLLSRVPPRYDGPRGVTRDLSGGSQGPRLDRDPDVLGTCHDPFVAVEDRGRGERLATLGPAVQAEDDVLLADDRECVDGGRDASEHHHPVADVGGPGAGAVECRPGHREGRAALVRSEEHTSELQSLMRIS